MVAISEAKSHHHSIPPFLIPAPYQIPTWNKTSWGKKGLDPSQKTKSV